MKKHKAEKKHKDAELDKKGEKNEVVNLIFTFSYTLLVFN